MFCFVFVCGLILLIWLSWESVYFMRRGFKKCICSWQSLVALLEVSKSAFVHDRVRSPWGDPVHLLMTEFGRRAWGDCVYAHDRAWSPCLRWFCAFALGRVRWPWGDLWIWRDVEIVQLLTKSANSWIGLEFFLKRKSFELHPVRGTQWKMVSTFPKPPT